MDGEVSRRQIGWRTAGALVLVAFVVNTALLLLAAVNQEPLPKIRFDNPHKLLVLAAHNDDEIIQAGGMLIRNGTLGGNSTVVVLTRELNQDIATRRTKETDAALSLIPGTKPKLISLDYVSTLDWKAEHIAAAKAQLTEIIAAEKPDIIVLPLKEDGHYEHDLLAEIGTKAAEENTGARILYTAEYNPIYLAKEMPAKVLWFLVRLLPGVPYAEPNYGLNRASQHEFEMTSEELVLKKRLLSVFTSQIGVVSETQFGYVDLIESPGIAPRDHLLIHMLEKSFSPWAFGSVCLLFLASFSAGALAAARMKTLAFHFWTVVCSCLVFAHLGRLEPGIILNDWLTVACFLFGMLSVSSVQAISFRASGVLPTGKKNVPVVAQFGTPPPES